MNSELIHRNQATQSQEQTINQPRTTTFLRKSINPVRYILGEQRFLFILVGITIAALFFYTIPISNRPSSNQIQSFSVESVIEPVKSSLPTRRVLFESYSNDGLDSMNVGGKVPLGLKRKSLRVLVTGGAGFVGSHLVDRLIGRGDSVIVVDNFFTGRKDNVMHHFGNPRFELIRHDVVEPILLEVDQIYHLACPASPVHYKFNPVKTIISFL